MNTLLIRLEGPLQSWGTRSRWDERDTALEPTKSGVIGLLACALGWGKDQDDAISSLNLSVHFGVRVDLPGRVIRDFQTISGGVMSAKGEIKVTPTTHEIETVQSPRFYLSDASFLVALQGEKTLISMLSQAVHNPVWPVFLGRKSCPLALPLWAGIDNAQTLVEALERWPRSARSPTGPLRASVETRFGQGYQRRDSVDSLTRRSYSIRYARDVSVDPPYPSEG